MNSKYRFGTEENREFQREIREELLRFGHRFPSPEGGSYWLGDDGTPWRTRNRETWITGRMVHVYSIGAMLGHEGSQELADQGLRGLAGELRDDQYDGWYAGVSAEGEPYGPKQCYAHAFVILAACSALLAERPGAKELLEHAMEVYDRYFWEDETGLSVDAWNMKFTELDSYRGLNANMHTVEAFLAAADAVGEETYRKRAGRIIDHVIGWAENNEWRIPEHYTRNWKADLEYHGNQKDDPFKPYGATPGHGIEWARLITQWAVSVYGEPGEEKKTAEKQGKERDVYLDAAEHLFHRAVLDAWDTDGARGIVYTTDWTGKPVVHDRMHWTLAEGINTAAVLHRVTEKPIYSDYYSWFMQYLDEAVMDHENGSWYHQLDQNNQVIATVWPGKADLYHALQSTLIPYLPVGVSIARAVHDEQKSAN